jgi:GNAT superfamily N-acetyltransferase
MKLIHTIKEDKEFQKLIALLNEDLSARYGELQKSYDKHNKIDTLDEVIVFYDDQKAIGCGAIRKVDKDTIEIKRVFVLPTYRNKGVAKMILLELEKCSLELGCKKSILETGNRQIEAIGFYNKNGYSQIPNYGQYKDYPNSLCFEKSLTGEEDEHSTT